MKPKIAVAAVVMVSGAWGQSAAKPLAFEVASIRPSDPGAKRSGLSVHNGNDLTVENWPLRNLIKFAYGVQDFQLIGGPGWIVTERFDISAKAPRDEFIVHWPADPHEITDELLNARSDHLRERVRMLLAERFGFAAHRETRETAIYLLSTGRSGAKLKSIAVPGDRQGLADNGKGHLRGFAATMSDLAHVLATALERPVVDRTELTGMYDFVLDWSPDSVVAGNRADDPPVGPTVFSAVQEQLGLKLEAAKGPGEFLVIDRVDRPSGN